MVSEIQGRIPFESDKARVEMLEQGDIDLEADYQRGQDAK